MLSFIFLSDGPCSENSWRVNDDKNQWWSRRDALVRIIGSSLWSCGGQWNGVVGDASLLFHIEENNLQSSATLSRVDYGSPAIVHCGRELCSRMIVPTERAFLRLWKDAFGKAENARLDVCIGGLSRHGVLCSNKPWKELLLNSKPDSAQRPPIANIDTSKMEKRELLILLQRNCNVEFLRKHGLNGSEALILKKKNRDHMLCAFQDWSGGSEEAAANDSEQKLTESSSYGRLVGACTVLLGGMLRRASGTATSSSGSQPTSGPTGYLLFLHEDYSHELNVFTSKRQPTTSSNTTLTAATLVPIVCAMGAVRDALDEEVSALMEAARGLGMRVVGANLGRTAEFTSKIVAALVHHARAGVLHAAVADLPAVEAVRVEEEEKAGNNKGKDAVVKPVIHKLAPFRKGGWTWDGQSNKQSSADRKRKRGSQEEDSLKEGAVTSSATRNLAEAEKSGQCHMHIVAWLPLLPAEVTHEMNDREKLHGLVQLVVTSLWRSRIASEASHESLSADKNNGDGGLSKVNNCSEGAAEADITKESSNSASGVVDTTAAKVAPVLYLVFADGTVAQLTQRKLAITMANQHMAAPSEYQVLQMLMQLLRDPTVLVRGPVLRANATFAPASAVWCDVLPLVLPQGLHKTARKAVRVVALTDTTGVCYEGGAVVASSSSCVDVATKGNNSISKHAYAGSCSCSCSSSGSSDTTHHLRQDVVILVNPPLCPDGGKQQQQKCDIQARMFEYVYPDKPLPSADKIAKKTASMCYVGPLLLYSYSCAPPVVVVSAGPAAEGGGARAARPLAPSVAVTVLQHFAYHDRLYIAIDEAISEAASDISL